MNMRLITHSCQLFISWKTWEEIWSRTINGAYLWHFWPWVKLSSVDVRLHYQFNCAKLCLAMAEMDYLQSRVECSGPNFERGCEPPQTIPCFNTDTQTKEKRIFKSPLVHWISVFWSLISLLRPCLYFQKDAFFSSPLFQDGKKP